MIYFASDFHLGLPNREQSLIRERIIIRWLDQISKDATDIFLVGDIFEFWYEWKNVVPKYYTRFLGKLAELSDKGIKLHFFTGNHDIWAYGYFEQELGMKIYTKPQEFEFFGKKIFVAHGDGLGPGDKMYKRMKKIFTNKFLQWLTSNFLHPDFLFKVAMNVSKRRFITYKKPVFQADKEWLIKYAKSINKEKQHDCYIFGHRHIAADYKENNFRTIILGEWINLFTYAVFDGKNIELKQFDNELILPEYKIIRDYKNNINY